MSVQHLNAVGSEWQALGELPRLPAGVRMDPRLLAGAACRNLDPDVFFPDPDDEAAEVLAKATCRRCPVLERCWAWAQASGDVYAILAATTPAERLLAPAAASPGELEDARAWWHARLAGGITDAA